VKTLYHILPERAWDELQSSGSHAPDSLATEGFVHYSWAHQWRETQQRHYFGVEGLRLLTVDAGLLGAPLRVENGFPHGYGPLPLSAVVGSRLLAVSRDVRVCLLAQIAPTRLPEADVVVLPELPFQPWFPAVREVSPGEEGEGLLAQQAALRRRGYLLGGGLVNRRNVACLWGPGGELCLRYEKLHLPQEPGFWEADHYDPGNEAPQVCDAMGFPVGVQLCSDIQRPFGSTYLQAQGAGAILVPRATESGTYERWRLVFQAIARMCCCYVLSVNRPGPEFGVPLGGPSVAVDPWGEILAETTEPELFVHLSVRDLLRARADYPGYLANPVEVYAQGWAELRR
jgi:omega-amidase